MRLSGLAPHVSSGGRVEFACKSERDGAPAEEPVDTAVEAVSDTLKA